MTAGSPGLHHAPESVRLDIEGMTCASCAARIEKRLNRMDGVEATVNYATERAQVTVDGDVTTDDLIAQVEAAGYAARAPEEHAGGHGADPHDHMSHDLAPVDVLRRRAIVAAVLSVPVVLMAMVPALQVDGWQWISLVLATPVVTWAAWPFHRATWTNLRHGAATMDTLVSVGVLAAYGWSLWALFLGDAGEIGLTHGFSIRPERGMASSQIYLEVASGVTTFLLAGRYAEAKAKRRSGAALRALMELGATRRRRPARRRGGPHRGGRPGGGRPLRGATRREGRDRRARAGGDLRPRHLPPHRRAGAGRGRSGRRRHRGHRERRGPPGGRGHPRRPRHRAGADRPPGRAGPDGQGPGPAPRRPRVGRLRPRGHRALRGDARLLAHRRGHRRGDHGLHRRGRRADHRLPLRPRAGDADRPHGRDRAAARSSASSSRDPRCWSRPGGSTPWSSTRRAR